MGDVANKLGQHAFHHETVLLSLIIRNLVTTAGETLQKNAEGYDMHRLYESLETLLRVLAGLRTWEVEP